MSIMFSDLLKIHHIDPRETHVARHHVAKAPRSKTPYELWLKDREAFHRYQCIQEKNRFTRSFLASFVGGPRGHTLFVGFYKIGNRAIAPDWMTDPISGQSVSGMNLYELVSDNRLSEFEGKLVLDWGAGFLAYVQNAENDKPILEIHRNVIDPPFPGYLKVNIALDGVHDLPPAWIERLAEARGIYLVTCPRTREHYVGSARCAEGFYGRWCQHATFQGDAVAFQSRIPSEYQVTILEVAGSGMSEHDILEAEQFWMKKLQSREMGLNARAL